MSVWLGQRHQRACAALVVLWLPLLAGCYATRALDEQAWYRRRAFRGVRAAYRHDRHLWIVYTTVGYWSRDRAARFWHRRSRHGRAVSPDMKRSACAVPKDAKPVAVIRLGAGESPCLPSSLPLAVFWRPESTRAVVLHGDHPDHAWQAILTAESYRPWWYHLVAPVTLAVDTVTFPVQFIVFLACDAPVRLDDD